MSAAYLLVATSFFIGVFLQRASFDRDRVVAWLNRYIIYLALPALILVTVPGLSLSPDALFPMAMPWLLAVIAFVIAFALGRYLGWRRDLILATALLMGLGNTAFFGVPLVGLYLGDAAVPIAVIYDQMGSFLVLTLVATTSIAVVSGERGSLRASRLLWRVVSFPPFLGLMLGLLLPAGFFPDFLKQGFSWLGASILPLAMLIVGLQLSLRINVGQFAPTLCVIIVKLLIAPALVLTAAGVFAIDGLTLQASFIQSAMPPMVTPAILLIAARIVPDFVATALGLATLVSFVTVPLWVYFLL